MNVDSAIIIDWENIPQVFSIETLLNQKFTPKLLAKIAVGNFCSQDKISARLHQDNYLMLNVPSYSNSADGKIITITMLLATLCRQIKVFYIVSNDRIFKSLQEGLILLGKTVYLITKIKDSIYANSKPIGKISCNSTIKDNSNPSLDKLSERICSLIAQNDRCQMDYGQLHIYYKKQYGKTLQAEYQAANQTGRILKHLQSSSRFTLTQQKNGYSIKLAK